MEKINYEASCSSTYHDTGGSYSLKSINDGETHFAHPGPLYNIAWSPVGNEYGRPDSDPCLKIVPEKRFIDTIKMYRAYNINDSRFRGNMYITRIDCEYFDSKTETVATNITIPFKEYLEIKIDRDNVKSLQMHFKPQSTHGVGVVIISELELYGPSNQRLYLKEDNSAYGMKAEG